MNPTIHDPRALVSGGSGCWCDSPRRGVRCFWGSHMDVNTECWKPIRGMNGYWISSLGRIRGPRRIRRPRYSPNGYDNANIRGQEHMVHRLVLEAFCGPSMGRDCDHIDGNPRNNKLSNLRWLTRSENVLAGKQHRRLLVDEVHFIRSSKLSAVELSLLIGCSAQTILNARSGRTHEGCE